ncbi:ATP-grasp domain-containing protein [Streptomyces sp. 1331.2]|uniref:ATP-grasp domain-containing protein n=1 Tax=Streptomyces sp. 1331.2 TaxID=1938835 RepID=UPI000BDD7EA2|nr:glutathione synthase [Streptomyces sp. 1331.2]SOB86328.1 RimK-like ATP-grasp domain-containing protein [Streptomyces sp. 1331.2]
MIVVCGIASESPIARVTAALDELGLPHTMLHQRRFLEQPFELEVSGTGVRGHLLDHGTSVDLAAVTGIYTRLTDWRVLPEVRAAGEETVRRCRSWHQAVGTWIELAPGRVMNRATATMSNLSKPYQAQLIARAGFRVPETLVTNDPELVHEFRARHGMLAYKSISSVRSIVRILDRAALDRLPLIRSCPVQFQRYVPGTNLRVHTVAGRLFATLIRTDRVDYRYAHQDGGRAELSAWQPPEDLAGRCLLLAEGLGLDFAGIDLLLGDDGEVYCFEVNPSPAFSYFEAHTGQPIARAVARALADR